MSAQFIWVSITDSIETLTERFWILEEPKTAQLQFTEEGQCEALFQ